MVIDTRLILSGNRSLPEVCAPLAAEFERCFWVVDLYYGPFKTAWLSESDENEALFGRQYWKVPAIANTSMHGFRPGTIPQLAEHLIVDE